MSTSRFFEAFRGFHFLHSSVPPWENVAFQHPKAVKVCAAGTGVEQLFAAAYSLGFNPVQGVSYDVVKRRF